MLLLVGIATGTGTAAVLAGGGGQAAGGVAPHSPSPGYTALPAAPAPALHVGRARPLAHGRHRSWFAAVRRPATARARPAATASPVARLGPRTPEGTADLVGVLEATTDARGSVWVRVRLPVLPNGRTGWVRRSELGAYETVTTQLVVDRRRLTITLRRDGRTIFRAPAGVGAPAAPTPPGRFLVRSKLTRYASPFYGPVAFGTSARSAVLTDWPDGGFVGIHGTDAPRLVPGRVSHGCIRLRNPDIRRLARLLPVGTPLTIR